MKLHITFKGEGREITVPRPTKKELEQLLAYAIRQKLKQTVFDKLPGAVYCPNGEIWEIVRDTVIEWSLNGYYPKEKANAES